MRQRLEIEIEDSELEAIRLAAGRKQLTVDEWVRQTLREACERGARQDVEEKLAALDRAVQHEFPTGDVDRMLAEIEGKTHNSTTGTASGES